MLRWYFYLVRCKDHTLYSGVTTDPNGCIEEHNAGQGAKYTRLKRPVRLVHIESFYSKKAALEREAAVRRWPKHLKEKLALGINDPHRFRQDQLCS